MGICLRSKMSESKTNKDKNNKNKLENQDVELTQKEDMNKDEGKELRENINVTDESAGKGKNKDELEGRLANMAQKEQANKEKKMEGKLKEESDHKALIAKENATVKQDNENKNNIDKNDGTLLKENVTGNTTTTTMTAEQIRLEAEKALLNNIASNSVISDVLQRALRQKVNFAITDQVVRGQFSLTMTSTPKILDTITSSKIVNGPPMLIQMYGEAAPSTNTLFQHYYKDLMDTNTPGFAKKTLELFKPETGAIRIHFKTKNTTVEFEHNPNEPISSPRAIVNPVRLDGDGMLKDKMADNNHLFNVIDAAIDMIIKMIPSCRVIVEGMKFGSVYTDVNRKGLIGLLGASKIEEDPEPHIILNINHPLKWFENEILVMASELRNELRIGETHVDDYLMGHGKRRRRANVVTDHVAASLYGVHCMRRQAHKMALSEHYDYLLSMACAGITFLRENDALTDDDYEFEGITQNMVDSYIFMYIVSNQFKNGIITLLTHYAMNFGIVNSHQLTSVVADIQRLELPASASRHIAHLTRVYQSLGAESYINLMIADMHRKFIRVVIKKRATKAETDLAAFDLLSNLILLFLFPSIARDNLPTLGYNICTMLYLLNIEEMKRFLTSMKYCKPDVSIPRDIVDDDFFGKGILPNIFDTSVSLKSFPLLQRIRNLLTPTGKLIELPELDLLKYPKLDKTKTVYMPWNRQRRQEGLGINEFIVKFDSAVSITTDVIRQYDADVGRSKQDKSGVKGILKSLRVYADEFGQFLAHEGYDLRLEVAKHFGYIYNDFNTSNDVYRPNDDRFGLSSADRPDELPWALPREVSELDWQAGLSLVMCIEGLLKPISDGRSRDNIKVTYPNPEDTYASFKTILKSCAEAVEPWMVTRAMLKKNKDPITNLVYSVIQNSGIRESYLNILHKNLEGKNVPEDVIRFMYKEISYRNKLVIKLPRVVMVDRMHDIIVDDVGILPDICKRNLVIGDEFLPLELDICQKAVFSTDSLALKIGKGITIQRTEYTRISPKNTPGSWDYEIRKITHEKDPLLTETFSDGKPVIAYIHPETKKVYTNFDSCDFPKIKWIAPSTRFIHYRYIRIIYKLIERGYWAFQFTDMFFQATVVYEKYIPEDYNMNMVKRIFDASYLEVVHLVFIDNEGVIYDFKDIPQEDTTVQMVFTTANLERDVIIQSILGNRQSTYGYTGIDTMHWRSGSLSSSLIPVYGDGVRKIDIGKPNFLNTIQIDNKDAVIRHEPKYEVHIPQYYFDAN